MNFSFKRVTIILISFFFFNSIAAKEIEEGNISRITWKENIGSADVKIINNIGDVRIRFGGYENIIEVISMEQHNETKGVLELEKKLDKNNNTYTLEVVRRLKGKKIELNQNDKARIDFSVFVPLGRETQVKTHNGTIQSKGMKDKIHLETNGGKIVGRKNNNLISAKSNSGDISFILSNHDIKGKQFFETVTGDINITVSDQSKHNVELSTSSKITTDFSIEITDLVNQEPDKKGLAIINNGGDLIKIASKRGNVSIRKYPE